MALVDTSMYRYENPDYFGNFSRGLLAGQQYKQNKMQMQQAQDQAAQAKRAQEEAQKFDMTLKGLMQVNDTTTPDGRMGLVRDLGRLGYGEQAMKIAAQLQTAYPSKSQSWGGLAGSNGERIINTATGEIRPSGYTHPQNPKSNNDPWTGTTWVNSGGKRIMVDAYGRDKAGNTVIQDKEPKQTGGMTDSQTASALARIASRADDDKAMKLLERRDDFYQSAKVAYDEYQNTKSSGGDEAEARRQADQQIIFSLAKMRDEGVVMPGEFARETSGQSWINSALNKLASGAEGGLNLSDDQRKYAVKLMGKFRKQAMDRAKPVYDFYSKQGGKYGDSDYVVGRWTPFFNWKEPFADSAQAGVKQGATAAPAADPRAEMAKQALNDPEATPEEKAQAKKILGIQ